MASIYYVASYGSLPLLINDLSTSRGRSVVTHAPEHGDRHSLSDHGLRGDRPTRCSILFCPQPGLADYLERYEQFLRLAEGSEAQIFTHPLDGSYRARIAEVDVVGSSSELCVRVTATIIREEEPEPIAEPGAGVAGTAGLEATSAAVTAATDALAAQGLTSDAPAAILEAVTAWDEAEQLDAQEVFGSVASLTEQLDAAIDELDLATDLTRWTTYQQMIVLRYQLVRTAEAFTATAAQVFDLFVDVPRPLIAICAEVYGAAAAQERAEEIARDNRIRTPGLVPRGTTLKMPRPGAAP